MNELVSIIVPVYNVEKYIRETCESVVRQTYEEWELILVDDCSTDHSCDVIQEWMQNYGENKIRLICLKENQGAACARNRGLQEARGRYIAYIDADDLWSPQKLERELNFLRENDAAFVFTGYEFADERGVGTGKVVHVPAMMTYRQALGNTTIFTSTVLFDTVKIDKGLLDMPNIKSEDTALWWKILRNGYTARGLDENLVKYRRMGKSLSSNKIKAIHRIWNLYRQAEGMGILASTGYFCLWAVNAVKRRL